jgi:outer membrane protein OmpA-like peptidoglycan-associated protein
MSIDWKNILFKTLVLASTLFLSVFDAHSQTFSLKDSVFNIGDKYITYDLLFEYNSSNLQKESNPILDSIFYFLASHPGLQIEVGVHCDERIMDQLSMRLTQTRAQCIELQLIAKGIPETQLRAKGYSDSQPLIVGAKTEEEHQKNRRVEIKILSID